MKIKKFLNENPTCPICNYKFNIRDKISLNFVVLLNIVTNDKLIYTFYCKNKCIQYQFVLSNIVGIIISSDGFASVNRIHLDNNKMLIYIGREVIINNFMPAPFDMKSVFKGWEKAKKLCLLA